MGTLLELVAATLILLPSSILISLLTVQKMAHPIHYQMLVFCSTQLAMKKAKELQL